MITKRYRKLRYCQQKYKENLKVKKVQIQSYIELLHVWHLMPTIKRSLSIYFFFSIDHFVKVGTVYATY